MKVRVYRNLHKACWSVMDVSTGRVVAHRDKVTLYSISDKVGVKFTVRPAGRAKVLRDKKKNVYAFVTGMWYDGSDPFMYPGKEVTYNPYKYDSFVYRDTGEKIDAAYMAKLDASGKVTVGW